jgi:hypothetical protein
MSECLKLRGTMYGHMILGICLLILKKFKADQWVPEANSNKIGTSSSFHNEQRQVSNYVLIPSHISRLNNNPKAV